MQWVRNPLSATKGDGGKQVHVDSIPAKEETLVRIPGAVVHLVEGEEQSVEVGSGEFRVVRLTQGTLCIGVLVKVGEHLRWPLTKDEPILKLDSLHYLFSLGPILNYGVAFPNGTHLQELDTCLHHYACFSAPSDAEAYWTAMAPRVQDYNSVLAKGIAAGSAQIIKAIFHCSQIPKGSDQTDAKIANSDPRTHISPRTKRSIRRVKKLSRMTEDLSKSILAGVVTTSGAVSGPILKSKAGQKLFSMLPGEVLLASLDAFNKVLDAAEVAGRNALSATSKATTEIVADRFGEDAGVLTHDGLAVAGHVIGTAWNVAKIRKAINPATNGTISSTVLKNARKAK